MKKFEIVINGQHEEEIGLGILQGIYAAIIEHGYTDVSVNAVTNNGEIQVPSFITNQSRNRNNEVAFDKGIDKRRRG